jgi:hypothetical protein
MKLIFLAGLLVVIVAAALEDEPIMEPEMERSMNEPCEDQQSDAQAELDSEYGNKFEGDMVLPENDESITKRLFMTGIINETYRWPKVGGTVRVPYIIDSVFSKHIDFAQINLLILKFSNSK